MAKSFSGSRKGRCARHGALGAKLIKRRKNWKNRDAVSEIIANMLIISITVIMFSGIFVFVSSMDGPADKVYTDFAGSISYNSDGSIADIKLVNKGGHPLENSRTIIYLSDGKDTTAVRIADGTLSAGDKWTTGTAWSYAGSWLTNAAQNARISVMIVDVQANMVVWDGILGSGTSEPSKPRILNQYLAAKVDDLIYVKSTIFTYGDSARLYVQIHDGGSALTQIEIDASSLNPSENYKSITKLNGANGWYYCDLTIVAANGYKPIHTTATNAKGSTTSSFYVQIVSRPNGTVPDGGGPPSNLDYGGLQGFGIFEERDWLDNGISAKQRRNFERTDNVVVVVASRLLDNVGYANKLLVVDTNKDVKTIPALKFSLYDYKNGYYIYYSTIDLDSDLNGDETKPDLRNNAQYNLKIQLEDNWSPRNSFSATDTITIGKVEYPTFKTYSVVNGERGKETNRFDSSDTVWAEITTRYVEPSTWVQNGGDVEIRDFLGGMELKRTPGMPAGDLWNPVSVVSKKIMDDEAYTTYSFTIDLSKASQQPWLPGNNAYILTYDMFRINYEDPEERNDEYLLYKVINIEAPNVTCDVVAGVQLDNSDMSGWSTAPLLNYYTNNNEWTDVETLEDYSKAGSFTNIKLLKFGDIDNSGSSDLIVVATVGGKDTIILYSNDGSWTKKVIYPTSTNLNLGTIRDLDLGNIDSDSDLDLIVSSSNMGVGFFRNDGRWTYESVPSKLSSKDATTVRAIDLSNPSSSDQYATSVDIVATFSTGVQIYRNIHGTGINMEEHPLSASTISDEKSHLITSPIEVKEVRSTQTVTSYSYAAKASKGINVAYPQPDSNTGIWAEEMTIYGGNDVTIEMSAPSITVQGQIISAILMIEYKTGSDYVDNAVIEWELVTSPDQTHPLKEFVASLESPESPGYAMYEDRVQIESSDSSDPEQLIPTDLVAGNLIFRITNPNTDDSIGKAISLKSMKLVVEIKTTSPSYEMNEVFDPVSVTVASDSQLSFVVEAKNNGDAESDNFAFQYSFDGKTYNKFNPEIIVRSGTYAEYGGILQVQGTGPKTIYIRALDERGSAIDAKQDTLYIQSMYISNAKIPSDLIKNIKFAKAVDVDGDGRLGMVFASGDKVWVCKNDASSISGLTNGDPITSPGTITSLEVGYFGGSKSGAKTIAVSTSNGVHFRKQSDTKWTLGISLSGSIKMTSGDIDGDRDDDLLLSVNNKLYLYTNFNSGASYDQWRHLVLDEFIGSKDNKPPIIQAIAMGISSKA